MWDNEDKYGHERNWSISKDITEAITKLMYLLQKKIAPRRFQNYFETSFEEK
jgi:hypothetical protein